MKTHYSFILLIVMLSCTMTVSPNPVIAQNQQTEPAEELRIQREIATEVEEDSLATYNMLDDLIIEAVRPVIVSDGAKTTYSVDEDPSSQGQTLIDVLRRVPGVTVDGQDNITIQGKSDFKIMVNGREEPMFSQNAKEIFKSMPANAVAKIEVITDPGAKFDAEGTAGILNLVTERRQQKNGYNGSLTASLSNSDYSAGGFLTGRLNKVTAQLNLNYSGNEGLNRFQRNNTETKYLTTGQTMTESMKQKADFSFFTGGYKLSWEPDAHNLFTSSFNFTLINANLKDAYMRNSLYDSDGSVLWETRQSVNADVRRHSYDFDFGYQHDFDDTGHLIVASYAFNFGDNKIDYTRRYDLTEGILLPPTLTDINSTLSRQHTVQIDYTNPFRSERHKLEAGVKGIFRHNSAFGSEKIANNIDSDWVDNPEAKSNIIQFQDILAAYATYSFTYNAWNAKAGLRYENTRMGIRFHDSPSNNFQTHLNDIVPNASVTYAFSPATNLRLAYSMRISRPTIEQVNPFEQILGYSGTKGNPDLTSERLNKFSLTYTSFGRVLGGSIGIDYSHTANAIEEITNNDGLYSIRTYQNSGDRQEVGFRGFLNWNIIRNMNLSLNGDLVWRDLKAPAYGYYRSGWGGNIAGNWGWRLENVANFGAFGGWGSRTLNLQGYWGSWYYYGISIGHDFLKDKSLNISMNAMSFIKPIHTFKSLTENHDVRITGHYRSNNLRIGLSLSWRFGTLQDRVKSTVAEIGLDDGTKSPGGNQGHGNGGGIGI